MCAWGGGGKLDFRFFVYFASKHFQKASNWRHGQPASTDTWERGSSEKTKFSRVPPFNSLLRGSPGLKCLLVQDEHEDPLKCLVCNLLMANIWFFYYFLFSRFFHSYSWKMSKNDCLKILVGWFFYGDEIYILIFCENLIVRVILCYILHFTFLGNLEGA